MKSIKQVVEQHKDDIPQGIYFMETTIQKDAMALRRLFMNLKMSPDNYFLEHDEPSNRYTMWWRNSPLDVRL